MCDGGKCGGRALDERICSTEAVTIASFTRNAHMSGHRNYVSIIGMLLSGTVCGMPGISGACVRCRAG
jgi:hypothetical protein